MAIHNDDRVGNFWVFVYARRNVVSSFQTRDLANAQLEADCIWDERKAANLPTSVIYARKIVNNKRNGRRSISMSDTRHVLRGSL